MILNVNEASQFLNANPQDVRYWAGHGQLPARNLGGEWYFSDATLAPYVGIFGGGAPPVAGFGGGVPPAAGFGGGVAPPDGV